MKKFTVVVKKVLHIFSTLYEAIILKKSISCFKHKTLYRKDKFIETNSIFFHKKQ